MIKFSEIIEESKKFDILSKKISLAWYEKSIKEAGKITDEIFQSVSEKLYHELYPIYVQARDYRQKRDKLSNAEMNKILGENMFKESKNIICYHVSQDGDIKVLRGYYSAKFKMKGIFVSLSLKSALDDWAPFVAGKKGHAKNRMQNDPQYYKTLTIYKLSVPQDVVDLSKDIHTKAADEYEKKSGRWDTYAAFYWGSEIFIPEQFLDKVQIVGRETKKYQEIARRQVHDHNKEYDIRFNPSVKMKIANELYYKNTAARYYIDLKDKLNTAAINFDKASLTHLNEYFGELMRMFLIFGNDLRKKTDEDLTEQDKIKIEELKDKIEYILKYKGVDDERN